MASSVRGILATREGPMDLILWIFVALLWVGCILPILCTLFMRPTASAFVPAQSAETVEARREDVRSLRAA